MINFGKKCVRTNLISANLVRFYLFFNFLVTENKTISDTATQNSSEGEEVERREKSVDLDLDPKTSEDNDGNEKDNVELPENVVTVSSLANNTDELQPATTETIVAETSTVDVNITATSVASSTSAPDDVIEKNTTDTFSSTNSSNSETSSNHANASSITESTTLSSNSTTDLLSMGSSEANFTDITNNTTSEIIDPAVSTANNRTGNERALEIGNQSEQNSHNSSEAIDSSNGRLVDSSQKSPEGDLELSGLLSSNNIAEQEITCLDSQFTCPRLPLVSAISQKTKRSIVGDEITASVSSKSPLQPHCLPQSFLCNGVVDCPSDSFDEMNCGEIKCGQNFMCGGE